MPVYSLSRDEFRALEETKFSEAGLSERSDLQRLLRDQIDAVAPGTLVISEEFGHWEGSSRRIDLLGIDENANIVIIELKRTEDGGHMDLQALRYAAMVSTMTFDQAVETFSRYVALRNDNREPRQTLLDHLGWDEPDQSPFGQDVKIVLASADFHPEVTTTVLWLNNLGLDVRCVRMKPTRMVRGSSSISNRLSRFRKRRIIKFESARKSSSNGRLGRNVVSCQSTSSGSGRNC